MEEDKFSDITIEASKNKEQYYGYIYKVTNLINGKIYVGQKKGLVNDSPKYYGSGLLIARAIKKYGKENFKKEIVSYSKSSNELDEQEKFWVEELKSNFLKGGHGYNMTIGGYPSRDKINFLKCWETRRKNGTTSNLKTWETRRKNGTDKVSLIHAKKIWEARRRNYTPEEIRLDYLKGWETRRKNGTDKVDPSSYLKGIETRRKNGNDVIGALKGAETRRRLGINRLNILKGWETRRKNGTDKLSLTHIKKIWENRRKNVTDKVDPASYSKGWETRRKNGTDKCGGTSEGVKKSWDTRRAICAN